MAEGRSVARGARLIGVFVCVVLVGVGVLLVTEGGHRSSTYVAKVDSVSTRPALKVGHQWVCVSGNNARTCTAIAPSDPGAPFEVGDCVAIDAQVTGARWKPRRCD